MIKRRYGECPTLDTRAEANESVDKAKRYRQIVSVMRDYKAPLTAKEIAWLMYKLGYIPTDERNFTAPRLTEMSKKGMVEPCGKKTCHYTGKTVTVYRLII